MKQAETINRTKAGVEASTSGSVWLLQKLDVGGVGTLLNEVDENALS